MEIKVNGDSGKCYVSMAPTVRPVYLQLIYCMAFISDGFIAEVLFSQSASFSHSLIWPHHIDFW